MLAKNRNGPTGDVQLRFVREYTRFDNLSGREEPDEGSGGNIRSTVCPGCVAAPTAVIRERTRGDLLTRAQLCLAPSLARSGSRRPANPLTPVPR